MSFGELEILRKLVIKLYKATKMNEEDLHNFQFTTQECRELMDAIVLNIDF